MLLHEALWQENGQIADACLRHPFVRGLADGTLNAEIFRRYVAQDVLFLHAFARAYALGAARSRDAATLSTFCELLSGVQKELKLHATYSQTAGIDSARFEPNPATRAYTDFLLATAWQEEPGVTVAAMSPCMSLYAYLGGELAGRSVTNNPYQKWVATYSSAEFAALVTQLEMRLDALADDSPAVHAAYRYAMQCELNFFSAVMEA